MHFASLKNAFKPIVLALVQAGSPRYFTAVKIRTNVNAMSGTPPTM
jgi:hypothetical protein